MLLKPQPIQPIPADIHQLAWRVLPATNTFRIIGDRLAEFVCDEDFVDLYSFEGKPALSPALLAMVTLFQYMENLSDRQAAMMVVTRIDWKYGLHLPLAHAGFHYSVLCEFRDRLVRDQAESRVFESLLEQLKAEGLVAGRGKQRTDALAVIGAVRHLNRLELAIEALRVALMAIEATEETWFQKHIPRPGPNGMGCGRRPNVWSASTGRRAKRKSGSWPVKPGKMRSGCSTGSRQLIRRRV